MESAKTPASLVSLTPRKEPLWHPMLFPNSVTVLVTGGITNICVRSTVHDAFFLGYEVVVPVECVAATSPQAQETSLYDIATHYGMVAPLDQVLYRLRVLETARTS
jgi:isochorismate hydrolase